MLINQRNLEILRIGFRRNFQRGLQSRANLSDATALATVVTSGTKSERYDWLGQFPKMREWVGDRVIKQLTGHTYTIVNKKYEATIAVDRDDIEDDTYGIYAPLFEEMGIAAAEWMPELVYQLIKSGESELAYDGQPFFGAAHPENGVTVPNLQAGGDPGWLLLDTTRALKPFIFQRRVRPEFQRLDKTNDENVFLRDEYLYGLRARGNVGFGFWQMAYKSRAVLNEANFDAAMQAMMSRVNDEGSTLGIRPNILVVGPENRAAAKQLIETQLTTNGGSNRNFNAVTVLVTPYLLGF